MTYHRPAVATELTLAQPRHTQLPLINMKHHPRHVGCVVHLRTPGENRHGMACSG